MPPDGSGNAPDVVPHVAGARTFSWLFAGDVGGVVDYVSGSVTGLMGR